jgi:hypothetical protein
VNEIRESIRLLKEKLREAMQAMARLQKARSALDNDISVKDSSVDIDLRGCINLRKNMALDPTRTGPIFSMPLAY